MTTSDARQRPSGFSRAPAAGFTLIEFVAVVATIAVLIGLLQIVYKVREAVSRSAAQGAVEALCLSAVSFERTHGRYPDALAEFVDDAHPAADGRDAGRRFTIRTTPTWAVVADPLPGVTGSDSAMARVPGCAVTFYSTPGAALGHIRMSRDVLVAGVRAFSDLAGLLPAADRRTALAEIRAEVDDPATQARALDALGDRGEVSLASVHARLACDGSVHPVACRFWKDVQVALQLGAYDEDWLRLPAVQATDRMGSGFIRLSTLVPVTAEIVYDRALQLRLQASLEQARRAARAGDPARQAAAIDRYLAGVADGTSAIDGTGRQLRPALSAADAWSLEALARAWLGEP